MRLKDIRKAAGYTQATAAEALGLNQGTYRNWEQGLVDLDGSKIRMLAQFFGVSTDELLGVVGNRPEAIGMIAEKMQRMSDAEIETVGHFVDFMLSKDKR